MRELINRYNRLETKRIELDTKINITKNRLDRDKGSLSTYERVHFLFTEAARRTRESFKIKVESLINLLVTSVFPNRDFEFGLNFYEARGQLECKPVILDGGEEFDPEEDMGGSMLDVVGIGFRLIFWGLESERARPIFFWDEPARYIGEKNIAFIGEIIKEISKDIGVQFIITTHNSNLARYCDWVWDVRLIDEVSVVEYRDGLSEEFSQKKPKRIKRVYRAA